MVSTKATDPRAETAQRPASAPDARRPWEDRSISPEERYRSYYAVARAKVQAIRDAGTRPGVSEAERTSIRLNPETQFWVAELRKLKGETAEAFCRRLDEVVLRELLAKNYLGTEAWQLQGIDVSEAPPIPAAVTDTLLNAQCPLHLGKRIKDTHLLVLIPKTVNGAPYSALKLGELCEQRKGSGDRLIYNQESVANVWKSQPWAFAPQAESEWVLLPKSDPDPSEVSGEKHFRKKTVSEQQKVLEEH